MHSIQYVTAIPNSGFRVGHKLDDLITGFILAELYHLEYLHSPLLDDRWEAFFGFGENEQNFSDFIESSKADRLDLDLISCSPLLGVRTFSRPVLNWFDSIESLETRGRRWLKRSPVRKIRQWRKPYWSGVPFEYLERVFADVERRDRPTVYCFQKAVRVLLYQVLQWAREGKVEKAVYDNVVRKLRQKYHARPHPYKVANFDRDTIEIGVHIRREDASVENKRFLPTSFYQTITRQLDELLGDRRHRFHIYSFGSDAEMNELVNAFQSESYGNLVEFHLAEAAMTTFHQMTVCDILVTGHSAFSDWAGFLSYNLKLYHPHFHMFGLDESDWVEVNDDGHFDKDRVAGKLQPLLEVS
ncbi:hypothetical protein [Baaleninema simplex]|uniref:hypothetical protein n=1 Tax=Baaleninema simplex TaxID=2862350 RepID=UPI00034B235F|nr:hypothetical protein [Baaleninema simplex]